MIDLLGIDRVGMDQELGERSSMMPGKLMPVELGDIWVHHLVRLAHAAGLLSSLGSQFLRLNELPFELATAPTRPLWNTRTTKPPAIEDLDAAIRGLERETAALEADSDLGMDRSVRLGELAAELEDMKTRHARRARC